MDRRYARQLDAFKAQTSSDKAIAASLLRAHEQEKDFRLKKPENCLILGQFSLLDEQGKERVRKTIVDLLGTTKADEMLEWLTHASFLIPHYMPIYSLKEQVERLRAVDFDENIHLMNISLEILDLQIALFKYGEANNILAHGVKCSMGGLVTFADILLEGRIIDRFQENQTPYLGILAFGHAAVTSGPFGPYYVVISDEIKPEYTIPNFVSYTPGAKFFGPVYSEYHKWYLVPTEKQKIVLVETIEAAVKKGLLESDEGREIIGKIKTYEEFTRM